MDVDILEQKLRELTSSADVKPWLRVVAHWTKRLKSDDYATSDGKEIATLRKLADIGIVAIEEKENALVASLTDDGHALSKDFFMKGYYL